MKALLVITFTILMVNGRALGQEIEQFFDFENGIYLSHDALMQNVPDIAITSAEGVYSNPLKILRINPDDFGLKSHQSIRYVVDQGLPYLRVVRCCPDQIIYVGLTIVGSLSLVNYESEKIVDIPMTAYNPYNNKPFLKGSVKRETSIKVTKILNMKNGAVYNPGDQEFLELVQLQNPIQDLEEMIDVISNYNKTNKIYITE